MPQDCRNGHTFLCTEEPLFSRLPMIRRCWRFNFFRDKKKNYETRCPVTEVSTAEAKEYTF